MTALDSWGISDEGIEKTSLILGHYVTTGEQNPWEKWATLQSAQDQRWKIELEIQVKLVAKALSLVQVHETVSVALHNAYDELISATHKQAPNTVSSP